METKTLPNLPILPLPVIDCNKIKVLVETKAPTELFPPGVLEATHITFSDEEVHHAK